MLYLAYGYTILFFTLNVLLPAAYQVVNATITGPWFAWVSRVSFCAQLHVMHMIHQVITTRDALWLLVTAITAFLYNRSREKPVSREPVGIKARPSRELHIGDSYDERRISSLVQEILYYCSVHWYKKGGRECQLEEGAAPAEIQNLDSLFKVKLFNVTLSWQYKAFLQLTNGLNNVLDGSGEHIDFMSVADSMKWAREIYYLPFSERQRLQELWATWLIESMLGPGAREELTAQVTDHHLPESRIRLIRIASCGTGSDGMFLVSPEDCREIAQGWLRSAFGDSGRCGSLIGRIEAHGETYFGDMGRRLEMLRRYKKWVVLQVRGRRRRLYPSFIAFLQTLAEISRRTPDELPMSGVVPESRYADHCRFRWELEWRRRSLDARRREIMREDG